MQLASHGAQAFARNAPQSARSIHIPAAIRPQARGLGQRLLAQTRQALTQFVTHLTTPGTGTVSVSRSFHAVNPTIQQRLSFTARTTLARPVHPHFVPRGPMLPRTMTQVGLGTARNFTSGRPLFQQLADNIPIAGRAFYEADWELNMHKEKERENILRPKKRPAKTPASKELLKQTIKPTVAAAAAPDSEMEHYFPVPSIDVTTHLLIPLAPTPTARAPLPEFPSARLPLPALLAVHDAHDTHALRVASLFQRLDAADVWARGAACSAYASTAGPDGVCTVLRVAFAGWSKAAVRGVIGESGTGWCVLEEVRNDAYDADGEDDAFSETSSILSGMGTPPEDAAHTMDPAQSFVLPTLDFSSSFLAASGSPDPFRRSNSNSNSSSGSGWGSAWDSDSDSSNRDAVFVDPPSENGWFESRSRSASASASEGNNPWLDSESDGGWHTLGLGLGFSSEFAGRQARVVVAPEPFESAFA